MHIKAHDFTKVLHHKPTHKSKCPHTSTSAQHIKQLLKVCLKKLSHAWTSHSGALTRAPLPEQAPYVLNEHLLAKNYYLCLILFAQLAKHHQSVLICHIHFKTFSLKSSYIVTLKFQIWQIKQDKKASFEDLNFDRFNTSLFVSHSNIIIFNSITINW